MQLLRGSRRSQLRRWFGPALVVVAAVVGLGIVLSGGKELRSQFFRLDLRWIALAFAVQAAGLLVVVVVWHRMLVSYSISSRLHDDIRIYCYGLLAATLPGGFWPILGRSALYSAAGASALRVGAASLVENFVIGIGAAGLYALFAILYPGASFWQQPALGLVGAVLAALMLHPIPFNWAVRMVARLMGRDADSWQARFRTSDLAVWISVEGIVVAMGGVSLYLLLSSLTPAPAGILPRLIMAWAAAVAAGNLFFWLPGTAIMRDGALVLALIDSFPLPVAVLFALLARVWTTLFLLIIAALAWLLLDFRLQRRRA